MTWHHSQSPFARRRPDPGPGRSAFGGPTPPVPGRPTPAQERDRDRNCDCNGPCMCAVPVALLRWFAAQVSVYHGPAADAVTGLCGQTVRRCGMCMLVASLHRAARDHWPGILP